MSGTSHGPSRSTRSTVRSSLSGRCSSATAAITVTGTTFTVNILWSTFGQRWIVEVVDQNGQRVVTKPLIGSPASYPINIFGGYFTSKLIYFDATNTIMVVQ